MPKSQTSKDVPAEEEKKPEKVSKEVKESKEKVPKEEKKPSVSADEATGDKEKKVPKEEASTKEVPKEKPPSTKGCLLIAEDERPLAHALELKFSHEGYETHIVQDGVEAFEMIKKCNPRAILLDLIMPRMDGFALLEKLKEEGINIPVIVLSNLGQDEDQERAKALGAKGYFVKSNTPIVEIVKYVKSVL
ncbi:response regulator [Patescibacteria group bacterium]|nr:response regulator [Patescibacteria group bacterium]